MPATTERILGHHVTRRTFIFEGAKRAFGLGALATMLSSPALIGKETTTGDILDEIYHRFGIEIPRKPESRFQVITNPSILNYQGVENNGFNSRLNKNEAHLVRESLAKIPAVGSLVQLIIPYRFKNGCEPKSENTNSGIKCQKLISGGTYFGYDWPLGRGKLHETGIRDFWHSHAEERPDPQKNFPSDKAGFELKLPAGISMDDPLPKIEPGDIPLGVLSSVITNGIELNINYEVPYSTHGEQLSQAVVHETGHALLDQVLIAQSSSFDEYYQRQSITLINGSTTDVHHPLVESFAKLNGWDLVPFSEYSRRFGADNNWLREYQEKEAAGDIKYFWAQNESIWGPLSNRTVRLNPYASYGPIQEAFCEFWMASILYPHLLTKTELGYFERIKQTLKQDPKPFEKIAQNPNILL